jgi:hypothetical protein
MLMKAEHAAFDTPHMQAAIMELQGLILQHYPNTTFDVVHGDDPTGIYVLATVDVEDTEAVVDIYIDRLLELQIDAGIAIYLVPVRPLARVLASTDPDIRELGE